MRAMCGPSTTCGSFPASLPGWAQFCTSLLLIEQGELEGKHEASPTALCTECIECIACIACAALPSLYIECMDARVCMPAQGLLTCFACDPVRRDWLVTGSAKGNVAVWDLRFQVSCSVKRIASCAACPAPIQASRTTARSGRPILTAGFDESGSSSVASMHGAPDSCMCRCRVLYSSNRRSGLLCVMLDMLPTSVGRIAADLQQDGGQLFSSPALTAVVFGCNGS